GPALGILEDENADWLWRLQIRLADNLSERMAELLKADHGFASGTLASVGKYLEWRGRKFDPLLRGEERRQHAKKQQSPHQSHYAACSRARIRGACTP